MKLIFSKRAREDYLYWQRTENSEFHSNTELSHKTLRLSNTSNITFHGIRSEALLILLDKEGTCASSGSACFADSENHRTSLERRKLR